MCAPQCKLWREETQWILHYRPRSFLPCNFLDNRPKIENAPVITYQGDDIDIIIFLTIDITVLHQFKSIQIN